MNEETKHILFQLNDLLKEQFGSPYNFFCIELPMDFYNNNIRGDIDILASLYDPKRGKDFYKLFEVKVTKILENGSIKPTRQSNSEDGKLKKQLTKLQKFGGYSYLFDILVYKDRLHRTLSYDNKEILKFIEHRKNIVKELGCGYLIFDYFLDGGAKPLAMTPIGVALNLCTVLAPDEKRNNYGAGNKLLELIVTKFKTLMEKDNWIYYYDKKDKKIKSMEENELRKIPKTGTLL